MFCSRRAWTCRSDRRHFKQTDKANSERPSSSCARFCLFAPSSPSRLTRNHLPPADLTLRLDPSLPSPPPDKLTLSVLPTLRTLLLRTQISRLAGKPLPKGKYRLVAILQGGEDGKEVRVEIPANEEGKEVGWWGLQDGDSVGVELV
jgi:hypothetical protein